MTYEEALNYIHSRPRGLPKPGLERIEELLSLMGDPHKKLRYVHVAGTNGKGSCCAMLSGILRAAGYKTGLYTSPFIHRFNERMQVNGRPIDDGELAEIAGFVRSCAEKMSRPCVEFEIVTAIGFEYFARQKCDIVVLEVGLGGRFDATNVIDTPDCALICSIGFDHMEFLGNTLEEIAMEKAGIIKPGGAVATYPAQEDEVIGLLARVCRERGASLRIAEDDEIELRYDDLQGQEFCYCDDTPLHLPLLGDHQCRNAAAVLEAVEILREKKWKIKPEAVEEGLANVKWPARFEILAEKPYVVADGGHNVPCAQALSANLDYYFEGKKAVIVLGMMADKDIAGFTDLIAASAAAFVCVPVDNPRAISPEKLAEKLKKYKKPTFVAPNVAEGMAMAMGAAGKGGVVCATGSLYLMGDVRAYFGKG